MLFIIFVTMIEAQGRIIFAAVLDFLHLLFKWKNDNFAKYFIVKNCIKFSFYYDILVSKQWSVISL